MSKNWQSQSNCQSFQYSFSHLFVVCSQSFFNFKSVQDKIHETKIKSKKNYRKISMRLFEQKSIFVSFVVFRLFFAVCSVTTLNYFVVNVLRRLQWNLCIFIIHIKKWNILNYFIFIFVTNFSLEIKHFFFLLFRSVHSNSKQWKNSSNELWKLCHCFYFFVFYLDFI